MTDEIIVHKKKLSELRVFELRAELEKRSLDRNGVKAVLLERLQKVLQDEGHDPVEYVFEISEVKGRALRKSSKYFPLKFDLPLIDNAELSDRENDSDTADLLLEVDADFEDDSQYQMDMNESNSRVTLNGETNQLVSERIKVDGSAVDNEDSINLTVEDDDQLWKEEEEISDCHGISKDEKEFRNKVALASKQNGEENSNLAASPIHPELVPVVAPLTVQDTLQMAGNKLRRGDDDISLLVNVDENSVRDDESINNIERREDGGSLSQQDGSETSRTSRTEEELDKSQGRIMQEGMDDTEEALNESAKLKSAALARESRTGICEGEEEGWDRSNRGVISRSSKSSLGSRNVWVSGLSSLTRASDLKQIFSRYGKVQGAKIVTNSRNPGARCYGFVTMATSEDASNCIQHLHHTEIRGRIISVEKARHEASRSPRKSERSNQCGEICDERRAIITDEGEKEIDKDESKEMDITCKQLEESDWKDDDGLRDEFMHDDEQMKRPSSGMSSNRSLNDSRGRPKDEEREKQRMRERERIFREEERRRRQEIFRQREIERRQREEAYRLERERERLRIEREKIEREKAELIRLERERQRLERERIEREKEELRRQQMKIEVARRAAKRTMDERPMYDERKRPTFDRIEGRRFPDDRRFEVAEREVRAFERRDRGAEPYERKVERFERPGPRHEDGPRRFEDRADRERRVERDRREAEFEGRHAKESRRVVTRDRERYGERGVPWDPGQRGPPGGGPKMAGAGTSGMPSNFPVNPTLLGNGVGAPPRGVPGVDSWGGAGELPIVGHESGINPGWNRPLSMEPRGRWSSSPDPMGNLGHVTNMPGLTPAFLGHPNALSLSQGIAHLGLGVNVGGASFVDHMDAYDMAAMRRF